MPRRSGYRRSKTLRKSGSTEWIESTIVVRQGLNDDTSGGHVVVPQSVIADMTEPTMVKAFLSLMVEPNSVNVRSAGNLAVGMRVLPVSVTSQFPTPFTHGGGDWFFHRNILVDFVRDVGTTAGQVGNSGHWPLVMDFEISSARKVHEDEQIVIVAEWNDLAGAASAVAWMWACRTLLRQP